MKICAYCTTENRNEAIFCTRCKRPLQIRPAQTPQDRTARNLRMGLLVAFVLLGLSSYLFLSRPFLREYAAAQASPSTSNASNQVLMTGPAPTRTQEPVTPGVCVSGETIRIRRGPGTQYETIGGLSYGSCLTILGRNEGASWVYVVGDDHQTGWVDSSLLSDAGDLSRVSVRDHSNMANSARPTLTTLELAHGAKVYLTNIAATNQPQTQLTRYVVPCFQTANRVGNHISCRMERAYCDYLPASEGNPTVCQDRPSPDQNFALVVFGMDWSEYDGQCIIVSGYLEIAGGALQVQALDRSQVSACE